MNFFFFFFFFLFLLPEVKNSSEEINHHPKTTLSFVIVWFDQGLLGLNCHGVFLPGKEGSPLHPLAENTPKTATNLWTTEPTLPLPPGRYMLWHKAQNSRPGHKCVKQCPHNLLHFGLSQKKQPHHELSDLVSLLTQHGTDTLILKSLAKFILSPHKHI